LLSHYYYSIGDHFSIIIIIKNKKKPRRVVGGMRELFLGAAVVFFAQHAAAFCGAWQAQRSRPRKKQHPAVLILKTTKQEDE